MPQRSVSRAERLNKIELLLLAHPEGLTQAELARRLGVYRSTIYRDLPALTERFAVYEDDDGRLKIDRRAYLTTVRFTLDEAMALHLATRLLALTTDKHNPHAATALRKLGEALEPLAPFISQHMRTSADAMDDAAQRHDPVYLQVLETLTEAWASQHKVRLTHQMPDGRIFTYTFAPYYLEPYPAGHTSHVIGWREPPGAIRIFKVERIRTVTLLKESYTIPADFDPRAHLAAAWGIWTSEAEPVEVVLRFHPQVARRVAETRWHPDQHLEPQSDGSLLWRAHIAEPQEMLPWIRGWGADVEVLAPAELRERMIGETRRLARCYGWEVHRAGQTTTPRSEHRFFDDFFGG